ncbi:CDP-alcohol phosphatidyltransferase family protein [Kiloniella laminariae]|uniref:CDP-alcohol phosphatidyltransferase family protein n=1 Tax=Kiloniella laminariae TaxID=454162 RepID=UPI0003635FDC|nr:CDP-alcohol phosphatidyltransferase family protein [Kiloniella laminariae]
MFDAWMRKRIDPALERLGRSVSDKGITANQVTWTGFGIGLMVIPALAFGYPLIALVCILLNRICDGLDGAVARIRGLSDLGGYLDITLDFLFYSAVVFGFALLDPLRNSLPAAFLIFSFVGTGSSFLAFAIVAEKRGISTDIRGKKSIYYLGGLTEGTETIALLLALCLWPESFPWLAWGFGALCWVTTAFRIHAAMTSFRP